MEQYAQFINNAFARLLSVALENVPYSPDAILSTINRIARLYGLEYRVSRQPKSRHTYLEFQCTKCDQKIQVEQSTNGCMFHFTGFHFHLRHNIETHEHVFCFCEYHGYIVYSVPDEDGNYAYDRMGIFCPDDINTEEIFIDSTGEFCREDHRILCAVCTKSPRSNRTHCVAFLFSLNQSHEAQRVPRSFQNAV